MIKILGLDNCKVARGTAHPDSVGIHSTPGYAKRPSGAGVGTLRLLCLGLTICFVIFTGAITAQSSPFYLGADLSYVNEMEDCGVRYRTVDGERNPYRIFAEAGANLVRLRLWHTPSWYDTLNAGRRYSDLADVKRAIARAKEQGQSVLLDFHLSDTWADPSRQIVPAAWAGVVDDLALLQDSLYNYVYGTLTELQAERLLPEMVQIGNETNKGILQSEAADAAGWALDWPRNAVLFNTAIRAVRAVADEASTDIDIALHIAGPENAEWLLNGFRNNGVTDFDVIGLSYYWAWHQPLTITGVGSIIARTLADFPGKRVMVFETGYIWTTGSNDEANNIISSVQPGYAPASPAAQRRWLIDLTQEVYDQGGSGVLYWEPAWVSSSCRTQWGIGSHQEHATFFDFDNVLLTDGGIGFLSHAYDGLTSVAEGRTTEFKIFVSPDRRKLHAIIEPDILRGGGKLSLYDISGKLAGEVTVSGGSASMTLPARTSPGVYLMVLRGDDGRLYTKRVVL